MTLASGPPSDSDKSGINMSSLRATGQQPSVSLDDLSAAFGGLLARGDDPYAAASGSGDEDGSDVRASEVDYGQTTPFTPRSILESMLFVGNPANEPLASKQVSQLMRGVRAAEIDQAVRDLNRDYQAWNCPYSIVAEGAGYRLKLREKYAQIRDQFYGQMRSAHLSQAAIDVLAIVAYQPGIAADEISRLRNKPSGHLIALLVRRQLLRLERGDSKPRGIRYFTTSRFLEIFSLASLADLPRSQDLEQV